MSVMKNSDYGVRMVKLSDSHRFTIHKNTVDLSQEKYTKTVHWHDFYELEMILSGNAIHCLNGQNMRLQPGSIYLLTPTDLHTLLPDPDAESSAITVFNLSFLSSLLSPSEILTEGVFLSTVTDTLSAKDFEWFSQLSNNMMLLKKEKGPYFDGILYHQVIIFLLSLLRLSKIQRENEQVNGEQEAFHSRELNYIQNAVSFIRYNFRDPELSVTKIAETVHLSPNYLGVIFKKHIGESLLSYVKKLRMNFAISLLQNSELTIVEIAEKCGYSSSPYFISDFKSVHGISPQRSRTPK